MIEVIQFQDDAPPGLLDGWARTRGLDLHVCRADHGEAPAAVATLDAAIVLGSEASVNDLSRPWREPVLEWTVAVLAAELPILGICFGAQLMATALGAPVSTMATPEIGWIEVDTADDGLTGGPWLAWHEDAIGAFAALRVVAGNPRGIQAFRAGAAGHQLGVQFHPEVTPAIVRDWGRDGGRSLAAAGVNPRSLERETQRCAAGAALSAAALFDAWGRAAGVVWARNRVEASGVCGAPPGVRGKMRGVRPPSAVEPACRGRAIRWQRTAPQGHHTTASPPSEGAPPTPAPATPSVPLFAPFANSRALSAPRRAPD